MKRLKSFYNILLTCSLTAGITGCADDFPGYHDGSYTEGETTVTLEAAFSPFAEGKLTRTSETPPGRGFNELSDLVVLVYDKEGKIVADDNGEKIRNISFDQSQVDDEKRDENNTSNSEAPAETYTKSLKNIKLTLSFGEYYIVGVANFGKYPVDTDAPEAEKRTTYEALKELGEEAYSTLNALRRLKVSWQSDNYRNNREMIGYFTTSEDATAPNANSDFHTVKINKPGMSLRAWLRRCASKITIDFDGTELRENVYIYIKDARIYDIPKECTLGFGKTVNSSGKEIEYNNAVENIDGLTNREFDSNNKPITGGHHIDYGEGEDFAAWPCIAKGTPYIYEDEKNKIKKDLHTQDSDALYFYENMQGVHEDCNRTPIPDMTNGGVVGGTSGSEGGKKNGVELGTYIVVTAHYHSDANGNIADYDVKYRFMLGKDVTTDYNAERNFHYKLTLKFRGNANDYSWQIDYDEPEGFDVPNPWYVSYLYNHDAMLPFKFTPGDGWEVEYIDAEIEQNPWYPSTLPETDLTKPDAIIPVIKPSEEGSSTAYTDDNIKYTKDTGNGFLSLRATDKVVIDDEDAAKAYGNSKTNWDTYGGYYTTIPKDKNVERPPINQSYFLGKGSGNRDRSKRRYYYDTSKESTSGLDADIIEREKYSWRRVGEKVELNIPLFTRAKVMVKQTGYSGNNPFVGYQRTAKLKLTAHLKKGNQTKDISTRVNVVQVRRVVNPKGIYRRPGNYEPFHVRMMWLDGDNATRFTPVTSHGPWRADIIGDANFITLNGQQSISGSTNSEINFSIRFNRMNTKKVKNAVVRVLYHNYTCTHLIFVRQGYDAQELAPNGKQYPLSSDKPTVVGNPVKWETRNMIAENLMAIDPRDEGSLFKFGNSSQPIDSYNNAYIKNGKESYGFPDNFNESIKKLRLTNADGTLGSSEVEWESINKSTTGFSNKTGLIKNTATIRHFEQLYLTDNIQFGYGVLYADGATETQEEVDMAYGYYRRDPENDGPNGTDSKKGMRGVFAYYWDRTNPGYNYNGRNVFFPIGRSGYGHRKSKETGNNEKGILRYSCNINAYAPRSLFDLTAPLFSSLYLRPGAIYWARELVPAKQFLGWNGKLGENAVPYGLDLNYFTFDVNAITDSNVDYGGDACFVRTIK